MSPNAELVRHRDFWRLALAGQLTALPMGVTPLAYTLLTAAILHSYRIGSVLVTVGVLAEVIGGPLAGRLLDRIGIARGLPALLAVAAVGYGLLAVLAARVPVPVLVALAVLPALPAAAFSGGLRTAMSDALPGRLRSSAVALDATLLEGTLIVGPLLAAGLAAISPTAALAALALAMLLAAIVLPRRSPGVPDRRAAPRTSLWRERRVAGWLLSSFGTAALFGSLEVGALGLGHRLHGGSSTAAVLLTLVSGASAASGLAFSVAGHRLGCDPRRRVVALMVAMGLGLAGVAITDRWWLIAPALVMLGLCTAPLTATQSLAIEDALPPSRRSEGFTLLASAGSGGYVIGSLAVAVLPLSAALLIGAAVPVVAAAALARIDRAGAAAFSGRALPGNRVAR